MAGTSPRPIHDSTGRCPQGKLTGPNARMGRHQVSKRELLIGYDAHGSEDRSGRREQGYRWMSRQAQISINSLLCLPRPCPWRCKDASATSAPASGGIRLAHKAGMEMVAPASAFLK